jgi:hypothetical protein
VEYSKAESPLQGGNHFHAQIVTKLGGFVTRVTQLAAKEVRTAPARSAAAEFSQAQFSL